MTNRGLGVGRSLHLLEGCRCGMLKLRLRQRNSELWQEDMGPYSAFKHYMHKQEKMQIQKNMDLQFFVQKNMLPKTPVCGNPRYCLAELLARRRRRRRRHSQDCSG